MTQKLAKSVTVRLDNLYVLSDKAVGPGKNPKLINVGPTSIPESRVVVLLEQCHLCQWCVKQFFPGTKLVGE